MSMILGLRMLSDLNIARVLADPPSIWQLIAPDDPDVYEQARLQAARNPGLFQRLFGAEYVVRLAAKLAEVAS